MTDLVLTLIGSDRPGLVEAVAEVIAGHGGNWLESRMAHLAGKFAGILRVEIPEGLQLPGRHGLLRPIACCREESGIERLWPLCRVSGGHAGSPHAGRAIASAAAAKARPMPPTTPGG